MNLFLFDFDGVLVESFEVYYGIVRATLEKINQPLQNGREEFLDLFAGNFYESLMRRGVNLDKFFTASANKLANVQHHDLKPVSGMVAVVQELSKKNVLLVISSNDSQTISPALAVFGYHNYFQEVLGSDFHISKKEKILHAVNKYRVAPYTTYYIGDTVGDIQEGRQAGVKTIGVTWGWHSKEKMTKAGPDYLLERPEELLQLN